MIRVKLEDFRLKITKAIVNVVSFIQFFFFFFLVFNAAAMCIVAKIFPAATYN